MVKTILFLTVSILLFSTKGYSQPGLVGYWSFDNFSNEIVRDQSVNSNSATVFEGLGTSGIKGKALQFNGSSSYAKITQKGFIPEVISQLGEGSISIWFKVEHIPLEHGIAPILYFGSTKKCDFFDAANQGLIIEVGHSPIYPGNRNLFFTIWKNGCTYPSFCYDSNYPIELNTWYHFVAIVDENYNTGYLNGKELVDRNYNFSDESASQFFADAVVHEEFWLGKGHWDNTEQYFDGAIDELKIFNRALNSDEVGQLFKEGDLNQVENTFIPPPANLLPSIYPNPSSNKLFLNFSLINFEVEKISIRNLNGNEVISHRTENCGNGIELGNLSNGIYSVVFIGKQESVRKKLMVLR